jgi:SAM-dependent methyltransferase
MTSQGDDRVRTRRACEVCGGHDGRLLFEQRFSGLSAGSLLDGYDVVVCRDCGFGFADGIPEQAAFDAYYRDMSKYEYAHRQGREPDWVIDRFRATAAVLRPLLPSPAARILDVGCATGGLLAALKEAGYPNVLGLDPSPACAEAARRLYGIRVLTKSLFELSSVGERFDLVILTGVLEHVRDLAGALGQLKEVVAAGGAVYVEVPDATAFAGCPNAPFQEFSLEHVNFFSTTSLANLMRWHGFALTYSGKADRELSREAVEPAVLAGFRTAGPDTSAPERDTETEPALAEYVRRCREIEDHVTRLIDEIAGSARPLIVWGTGSHTLRLLASSRLGQANVRAFIDSNPRYHGKRLNGIPIVPPAELVRRPEPVLISSWVYQRDIERQIREQLAPDAELILLYEPWLGAATAASS